MEEFEAGMIEAIRARAPGESVTAAFGRIIAQPGGLLTAKEPEAGRQLATIMRIVADSPALLARERQTFDRYTRALAGLIAEETGARPEDVEPWVVANALLGVHRALLAYVRGQVLAGRRGPGLVRAVRAQAERSLAVLERGIAGYPFTRRPAPGSGARPRPSRAP
jgi:hypothetical protein